jgi:hypothetical protein
VVCASVGSVSIAIPAVAAAVALLAVGVKVHRTGQVTIKASDRAHWVVIVSDKAHSSITTSDGG